MSDKGLKFPIANGLQKAFVPMEIVGVDQRFDTFKFRSKCVIKNHLVHHALTDPFIEGKIRKNGLTENYKVVPTELTVLSRQDITHAFA